MLATGEKSFFNTPKNETFSENCETQELKILKNKKKIEVKKATIMMAFSFFYTGIGMDHQERAKSMISASS